MGENQEATKDAKAVEDKVNDPAGGEAAAVTVLQEQVQQYRNDYQGMPGGQNYVDQYTKEMTDNLRNSGHLPELAVAWAAQNSLIKRDGTINNEDLQKYEDATAFGMKSDDPVVKMMMDELIRQRDAFKADPKNEGKEWSVKIDQQSLTERWNTNKENRQFGVERNNAQAEQNANTWLRALTRDGQGGHIMDKIDVANQYTNSPDGVISKEDLNKFITQVEQNPNDSMSKNLAGNQLETLKYLRDNWDSPEVKAFRGDGKIDLNKIAKDRGLENRAALADAVHAPGEEPTPLTIDRSKEPGKSDPRASQTEILDSLSSNKELYDKVADNGTISKAKLDKITAGDIMNMKPEDARIVQQLKDSYNVLDRAGKTGGNNSEGINLNDLSHAVRGPREDFKAPGATEQPPAGNDDPNRGRTPSESAADLRGLFTGDKGKTLYERLTGPGTSANGDANKGFNYEDVKKLQANPPADLTEDQKKYLAAMNENTFKQMDRDHKGTVNHQELQAPVNEKADKSVEQLRQENGVEPRFREAQRENLRALAANPAIFDKTVDAQGNMNKEAVDQMLKGLTTDARTGQPLQLSETQQKYVDYLKGKVNPENGTLNVNDLAKDAGYSDFRSFQVQERTVPVTDQDKAALNAALSNPEGQLYKDLVKDGKIDRGRLDSLLQSMGPENPNALDKYSEQERAALGVLERSFNRLSTDPEHKTINVADVNKPPEPPKPEMEEYKVVSGDNLTKIANKYGMTLNELIEAQKETHPEIYERIKKNPNLILIDWPLTVKKKPA
jgi:LysM repeat protein